VKLKKLPYSFSNEPIDRSAREYWECVDSALKDITHGKGYVDCWSNQETWITEKKLRCEEGSEDSDCEDKKSREF